MPTGYTAGILDGSIKDFRGFAEVCMRAFGATIHMRDDSMSKKYEPRVPSEHHLEKLKELYEQKTYAERSTDEVLIRDRKDQLIKNIIHCKERIIETNEGRMKLLAILEKVKRWIPPTTEHREFKKFMIDQLEQTIDFDGKIDYAEKELIKLEMELSNLNADRIRKEIIEEAERSIAYHTKENNDEIRRCEEANNWVKRLLESLK